MNAVAEPERGWSFSALNADGCPIEIAFSSSDDKLRYTTEVAGPELETHPRLNVAAGLASRPGDALSRERLESLRSLQSGRSLRWGTWLGVREGTTSLRFKLYVEIPPESAAAAGAARARLAPDSELLMLGYDCESGACEYYFRQPPVNGNADADRWLRHFETERRTLLLGAFETLCGVPARVAFRWMNAGYSVVPSASGEPALTLFVRSRSLGNAAKIRSAFLAYEARAGKAESSYRALLGTRPESDLPDHGTVGLTAREGGSVEMRVGVSAAALGWPLGVGQSCVQR